MGRPWISHPKGVLPEEAAARFAATDRAIMDRVAIMREGLPKERSKVTVTRGCEMMCGEYLPHSSSPIPPTRNNRPRAFCSGRARYSSNSTSFVKRCPCSARLLSC